jgi:hypothetical protein
VARKLARRIRHTLLALGDAAIGRIEVKGGSVAVAAVA